MNHLVNALVNSKIRTKIEALRDAPAESGAYAWFFKEIPLRVPSNGCFTRDSLTLLYVGISPSKPPNSVNKPSSQNLRKRILNHYDGNAYGSTLRLTLGCLLSEKLGITLRRVGGGERMTFTSSGEEKLSNWMQTNAYVAWLENKEPWTVEAQAISEISLPLNLRENEGHPFYSTLTKIRREAREKASSLPIIIE